MKFRLVKKPSITVEQIPVTKRKFAWWKLRFVDEVVGYVAGKREYGNVNVQGKFIVGQTFNKIQIEDWEFTKLLVLGVVDDISDIYECTYDYCRQLT